MPTYTALTTLMGEDAANALAEAIEKLEPEPTGVGVFEIEDDSGLWEVGAYFLEPPNEVMLEVLALAFEAKPFALSELPEIDWVAKVRRELAPVEAGRFFVYGSHDADKVPADRVALQIEATVAFGTGHHGTTLGCLRAFDRLYDAGFRPAKVADIGCGTAVLAHGGGGCAARCSGDGRPTLTKLRWMWPRPTWRSTTCRAGSRRWRPRVLRIRVWPRPPPMIWCSPIS